LDASKVVNASLKYNIYVNMCSVTAKHYYRNLEHVRKTAEKTPCPSEAHIQILFNDLHGGITEGK
jgi:hypothetical protein